MKVLLSALAVTLFTIVMPLYCSVAQGPIQRPSEPVIMTGAQIVDLLGVAPVDIVGFRHDGTDWFQIPVQIDERDSIDGETIYGHTPPEEFLNENWGTDLDKLVILTYTDTATFTGPDKDPFFDDNDEFLFMARDAGVRYSGADIPTGVEAGTKVEVRLVDPLTQDVGYIYLFEQTGDLDPSAGKQYVDYRFNLLSGNYKETYTIGGNFDPEDSYVNTAYYQTHFSDRWIKDRLIVPANGATAYDTINILDQHKTLLEPNNCGRTEVVFSSQEGAFVTNKTGPIRAIRSYFGANSGPLDQREHFFYEQSEKITFYLRMHSIRGIVDFMDHSPEAIGMRYKNNNNADEWINIDGVPEEIAGGLIEWEILTGDQGSWIAFSSISHNFNETDVMETYYEDNLEPVDTQCTGDKVAIGAVGHFIPIRIPLTDPRGLTTNRLSLTRENYYQAPNLTEQEVFILDEQRKNPISSCAGNCDLVPVSPTNLVVTDTTAKTVTITWVDNAGLETNFVIERAEEDSPFFTEAGVVDSNTTAFTDTGLKQSTDYKYRVKAVNGNFSSTYTNIVELKTKRDVESAPTELQMIGRTATSVALSWEDNTTNETGFSLERTGPGDNEQFFVVASVEANVTTYTDKDLLTDTQYSYRIQALVSPINTTYSNILHAKTAGEVPEAPSDLNYQARSSSLIALIWQDNSSNEDGFIIERTTGNSNEVTFRDTVGISVTGYTDVGLQPKTIYRYKVTAFNEGGSTSSAILATKTAGEVPQAPSDLSATIKSKTLAALNWVDNAIDEAGFIIERSTSEDVQNMVVIDTVGIDVTSYEDQIDLDEFGYYMYRVKAFNEDGPSPASNTARTSRITGIEEDAGKQVRLFPNPGNDYCYLEIPSEVSGDFKVTVIDQRGRQLQSATFSKGQEQYAFKLHIGQLPQGLFFVILEGENIREVKRMVKLK